MTLHFFHRYDRIAASFRARCECYAPYLDNAGIPYQFHSLLDKTYLHTKYVSGNFSFWRVLKAYFRRVFELLNLNQDDVVIVHLELFPYFPGIFEKYLRSRGIRLIYDFDDPFYHHYDQHRYRIIRWLLGNKVRKIIRHATAVIAGNNYLKEYAASEQRSAIIIPSVIDLDRYVSVKHFIPANDEFIIGWIGTPSTLPHLRSAENALKQFCRDHKAKIVLIGSGTVGMEDFPADIRPWSESSEISDILEFDVGIMPLPDNSFNRGKGGMKIMQYMACGIPTIASPIGFNCEIIKHGLNGFLATSDEEWISCLKKLYEQPLLRQSMGAAGRETIVNNYCLQVTATRFMQLLKSLHLDRYQ